MPKNPHRTGRHLAADLRRFARGRSQAAKSSPRDPRQMPRLLLLPGQRGSALRGGQMPVVAIPGSFEVSRISFEVAWINLPDNSRARVVLRGAV